MCATENKKEKIEVARLQFIKTEDFDQRYIYANETKSEIFFLLYSIDLN